MNAKHRLAALGLSFAAACAQHKPAHEVGLGELGFDHCVPFAGAAPRGNFTLWMVVLADGSVPAAFVHDALPRHRAEALRCFAETALQARFPPQDVDSISQLTLVCGSIGRGFWGRRGALCSGVDNGNIEQPLDESIARDTLAAAEWASAEDRGWAMESAGMHAAALEEFRAALQIDRGDARALRGLAQALISSGGDLKEAREAALGAVRIDPNDSSAHEAMLRVCLAERDDACVARETPLMNAGFGVTVRSASTAPLAEAIGLSNARLQAKQDAAEQAAIAGDPTLPERLRLPPLLPAQSIALEPRNHARGPRLNVDARAPEGPIGAKFPVLFLPGLGGGVGDFSPQLAHLESSRRVAAIELPGEGFSDPLPAGSYTLENTNRELLEAMDALEFPRALLVANGLGASLAVAFAAAHPERVAGLLLIDPLGDLTLADPAEVERALADLSSPDYLTTLDLFDHGLLRDSPQSTRLQVLREAHRLRAETSSGYFSLAASLPIAKLIRSLPVPVHAISTSFDDEPFDLTLQIDLKNLVNLTVANSSPWVMLDQPAAVNAQLDAMLAALENSP